MWKEPHIDKLGYTFGHVTVVNYVYCAFVTQVKTSLFRPMKNNLIPQMLTMQFDIVDCFFFFPLA